MLYAEALLIQESTKVENTVEDILAVDPENIDALLIKARILTSRKKYDEAIEVFKEISLSTLSIRRLYISEQRLIFCNQNLSGQRHFTSVH